MAAETMIRPIKAMLFWNIEVRGTKGISMAQFMLETDYPTGQTWANFLSNSTDNSIGYKSDQRVELIWLDG